MTSVRTFTLAYMTMTALHEAALQRLAALALEDGHSEDDAIELARGTASMMGLDGFDLAVELPGCRETPDEEAHRMAQDDAAWGIDRRGKPKRQSDFSKPMDHASVAKALAGDDAAWGASRR